MDQQKKIIFIVVAILVIGIFGFWANKQGWLKKKPAAPDQLVGIASTIKDVPNNQIPSDMPQDIVLPKDAVILHTYTAALANGQNQSTLIYSTSESTTTLNSLYINYLSKNNWALISSGVTPNTSASGTGSSSFTAKINSLDKGGLEATQNGNSRLVLSVSPEAADSNKFDVYINLLISPPKK